MCLGRLFHGEYLVDRGFNCAVLDLRPNVFHKLRENVRFKFGSTVAEHTAHKMQSLCEKWTELYRGLNSRKGGNNSHRNRAAKSVCLESIRDAYSVLLLLHESSTEHYYPNERRDRLAPALDYISRHFAEPIKNDTLAEICGMSNVYFRKMFTAVYGTSPIAYTRDLRIRKAKEMLRGDYSSISDIAFSLGYPSLYDFFRDFKKHTGVPPSKY